MTATTVTDKQPLTPSQVILKLQAEAKTNLAFNAVCHVFATRERARQQVTLDALTVRMVREGFKFERKDYAKVLQTLALLGIGYLEFEDKNKNEISALKNIRITLQSIGQVALGTKQVFAKFTPDIQFKDLAPQMPIKTPVKVPAPPKQDFVPNTVYQASLVVVIDGQPVTFDLPKGLTTKDLGFLLADLFTTKGEDQST